MRMFTHSLTFFEVNLKEKLFISNALFFSLEISEPDYLPVSFKMSLPERPKEKNPMKLY
jgi:hypothetical protein